MIVLLFIFMSVFIFLYSHSCCHPCSCLCSCLRLCKSVTTQQLSTKLCNALQYLAMSPPISCNILQTLGTFKFGQVLKVIFLLWSVANLLIKCSGVWLPINLPQFLIAGKKLLRGFGTDADLKS